MKIKIQINDKIHLFKIKEALTKTIAVKKDKKLKIMWLKYLLFK
ncbi:hypothetical protein [Mycoplasma synoviae]